MKNCLLGVGLCLRRSLFRFSHLLLWFPSQVRFCCFAKTLKFCYEPLSAKEFVANLNLPRRAMSVPAVGYTSDRRTTVLNTYCLPPQGAVDAVVGLQTVRRRTVSGSVVTSMQKCTILLGRDRLGRVGWFGLGHVCQCGLLEGPQYASHSGFTELGSG